MICKGTTHNNGAKLAHYMTTAKPGERAELWQLLGFAAGDIRDAFRSVHVMADATRCEQPFFHVQVRNPEGEDLSRDQWRRVADRIEAKLGLTNQPRAIAFHTDERTGHEHMHLSFSRIDADTMTARPLPFFKERLKEVSRELENTFDLTRVRNDREGQVLAPTRDEFEQARRLGVDAREVRQTIRDCYDRSDCGRSFEAALIDHGLILAQGDRRDFVVIDHAGGMHALGKRILGVSAAQLRERCADIERNVLPTVNQAREFIMEQGSRKKEQALPMPDQYRNELSWQDALHRAAIEKEKIERRFVEPAKYSGGNQEPKFPEPRLSAAGRRDGSLSNEQAPGNPSRAVEPTKSAGFAESGRAAGKIVDGLVGAIGSLFPAPTPEQRHETALASQKRRDEAERTVELSRFLNVNAIESKNQEDEARQAARNRELDDRER